MMLVSHHSSPTCSFRRLHRTQPTVLEDNIQIGDVTKPLVVPDLGMALSPPAAHGARVVVGRRRVTSAPDIFERAQQPGPQHRPYLPFIRIRKRFSQLSDRMPRQSHLAGSTALPQRFPTAISPFPPGIRRHPRPLTSCSERIVSQNRSASTLSRSSRYTLQLSGPAAGL